MPLAGANAQSSSGGADAARQFVGKINDAILFPLIALMIGVAMIVFLYGAFKYVMNADNDTERQTGARHMLWGVIGFLVMVSAMAILEIAANTFNLGDELQDASPR